MPRPTITCTVNLDDRPTKQRLMSQVGVLSGLYEVRMVPRCERRSASANRYYWGVVVEAMRNRLSEEGQDITADECHYLLRMQFLSRPVADPRTGVVIGNTASSTATLDAAEFSEYVEKCIAWLSSFGVEVPCASEVSR